MVNNMIKIFFDFKKKSKCITVVKDRELSDDFFVIKKSNKDIREKTCLSEYFSNREGLNMFERFKFSNQVIKVHNQR